MASNNNRPLLVVHDDKEGHLVYDLLLLLLDGEAENDAAAAALACFPRPVAHFAASLGLRALAVSGGAVVGAFYRSTTSGATPSSTTPLDTTLFDGHYAFESLRPPVVTGAGGWQTVSLPKPPIVYADGGKELVWVSAYFAVGTRVWISAARKGTFSFDGTWRMEGRWELPFEGRALHVPELGCVIGLAAGTRLLCAYDFVTGKPPVMRRVWTETCPEGCIYTSAGDESRPSRPRDVPSLAYLGNGRFCICRPMSVMEPHPDNFGPPMKYNAASFLVVVLRRSGSGELELVRRGKTSFMCFPKSSQISYIGFIQPAISN
ncbi:hypothetical protein HU200_058585 [Digitaria exilis]|uniref:Uncharacterized protein n=1 Tax=Digitaria exilis TaxID=1010633 RepID=A0A835AJD4_9POAL|nr:hypothetical protein HU200_058585 [Digitaria exilis]